MAIKFFSIYFFLIITVHAANAQDTTHKKTVVLGTIKGKTGTGADVAGYYLAEGKKKGLANDYTGAISDFSTALDYDSTSADTYFNRALSYYYLNKYTEALADVNMAIRFDSLQETYYDQRGICNTHLYNYPAAKKDFDKALQLKPNSPTANLNMGVMYLSTGNYDEACVYLQRAKKLGSDRAQKAIDIYCRGNQ